MAGGLSFIDLQFNRTRPGVPRLEAGILWSRFTYHHAIFWAINHNYLLISSNVKPKGYSAWEKKAWKFKSQNLKRYYSSNSQPVGLGTGVEGPLILSKWTAKPYSHQAEAGFVNRPEVKTFIASAKFAISNSCKTTPIISLNETLLKKWTYFLYTE